MANINSLYNKFGAGNEIRTRDPDLGKVVLYQLSYSRIDRVHNLLLKLLPLVRWAIID